MSKLPQNLYGYGFSSPLSLPMSLLDEYETTKTPNKAIMTELTFNHENFSFSNGIANAYAVKAEQL